MKKIARRQQTLRVDGEGSKPFYMEGMMCDNYFEAIIDTGSPVSIFTKRDLQNYVGERKVVIRDMIGGERYVDYNTKPLNLLGYQFVRPEVAGVTVSKGRVLVAPKTGKSIWGRDWLVALRYKITQLKERGECEVSNQSVNSNNFIPFVRSVPKINKVSRFSNFKGNFQNCLKEKDV